jgi:hypothetical protein
LGAAYEAGSGVETSGVSRGVYRHRCESVPGEQEGGIAMNRRWFRLWGWLYVPVSWEGFALSALVIAFWINVFLVIDRHSHSASDTLYGVFPYVVPSFLVLLWIAGRTSRE